jgi:Ca-activated chloride channel family protein
MSRALVVLVGALAAAVIAVGAQNQAFRASVHTVPLYPLVSGADGRLVTNLTRDDFIVLDNGAPAAIDVFSSETQPITATLLLDMSSSMDDHLTRVRESATSFVRAIGAADRVRIGTFGSEVALSPLLTGDKAVLERILREELWPGGSTPLWTALDGSMKSLASETGRRIVVVVTDGVDTSSASQTAVIDRAIGGLFMIYAIGLEGRGVGTKLVDLITKTGGGHFVLQRTDDLSAAFDRLTTELRHQYLVGFTPSPLDGRVHELEVRVKRPGMTVQAPKQFVAGTDK